jgi:ribonuclease HI
MATFYTDGSCNNNTGVGGFAWIRLLKKKIIREYREHQEHTTSNRMELSAVISAMHSLKNKHFITVYTDSMYVIHGFNRISTNRFPESNTDLWYLFKEQFERHHEVQIYHVKGHAGNAYNERCDELAGLAYKGL